MRRHVISYDTLASHTYIVVIIGRASSSYPFCIGIINSSWASSFSLATVDVSRLERHHIVTHKVCANVSIPIVLVSSYLVIKDSSVELRSVNQRAR